MVAWLAEPVDVEPEEVEPEDVEPEDVEPEVTVFVELVLPVELNVWSSVVEPWVEAAEVVVVADGSEVVVAGVAVAPWLLATVTTAAVAPAPESTAP